MQSLESLLQGATGVTCHSGQVQPGFIFVAIRGRKTDGNQYISDAIHRGANAIVTDSPARAIALSVPVAVVADPRQALAWLAARLHNHPSQELALIGVTGSNGKTTITYMLEQILQSSGCKTGLIGTVRINDGASSFPSILTTPDAASLQRYLRTMRQHGVTHAAMEVSAQGIEMRRTDYVHFSCGILSNICPDHLDFHQTFASYVAAKTQFLRLLGTAPLIMNVADAICREITASWQGPMITVSPDPLINAMVTAIPLSAPCRENRFLITVHQPLTTIDGETVPPQSFTAALPLPGFHNRENALLAAVAALLHGIQPSVIATALALFRPVERRFNLYGLRGCTVLDDTALNPGSIHAVYRTLQDFRCRSFIAVHAIRGNRGPAINQANAAAIADWHENLPGLLIVTDSSDQTTCADQVNSAERQAFLDELTARGIHYRHTATLAEAVGLAAAELEPGTLLALLGAQGMDNGLVMLRQALEYSTSINQIPYTYHELVAYN